MTRDFLTLNGDSSRQRFSSFRAPEPCEQPVHGADAAGATCFDQPGGAAAVYVAPTHEGTMIARHRSRTLEDIGARRCGPWKRHRARPLTARAATGSGSGKTPRCNEAQLACGVRSRMPAAPGTTENRGSPACRQALASRNS